MDYYSVPRRLLRGARQLVYPRRCPFCDQVLGSVPTCPDCAAELEELRRKPGMRLDVRLADGRFGALVTDVTREPVEKDDGLSGVRETDT